MRICMRMRMCMCMCICVCVSVCICVYMCVYAYVKISTIYHQAKKRVDPPAGPQSKSLFDPSKKINTVIKDYIFKSVVFLLKIIKNKKK